MKTTLQKNLNWFEKSGVMIPENGIWGVAERVAVAKNNEAIETMLGDIIVSVEKVREQAEEYGHSFKRELAYLVTHGMLHLLGYDHMIEEEKVVMRKREEEIWKNI